jgi:membrane protein
MGDDRSPSSPPVTTGDRPRSGRRSSGLRALVRVRRSLRLAWRATRRGVVEFYFSDNLTYAASIAYYSLLSLFPFLLLLLSAAGTLAAGPLRETLQLIVDNVLPSNLDDLAVQIQGFRLPPGWGVLGMFVALWASMGVFGAVTSAVNHAWGVEEPPGFFKHKVIAFVMLMAAGVLFVAAVLLIGLVEVVRSLWFADVVQQAPALGVLSSLAYRNAPTPMFVLVVGLIYYYVPNAKVRLRDVWFGAILAGLLWRFAFSGFSVYFRDLSQWNIEGSVATVIVFLFWMYVSAVILLYGVEVTAAFARERQRIPAEAPAAPAIDI